MAVNILTEAELRKSISLDAEVVEAIRGVFTALAGGAVVMPPILSMEIAEHHGEVDVKTAYVPGLDSFAIKISPGFFDNPKLGLPSVNGLMVLFSSKTGLVEAVLLDNGYLIDIRTAAAGAVADCLARTDATTAGIIGAGTQGKLQLQALALVRPLERALVWARDTEKAKACAEVMSASLAIPVEATEDRAALVRGSDVVVTTTPSREALIEADWLHPGLHITAMGSDAEMKQELASGVLSAADLLVCDRRAQSAELGELRHAIANGALPADAAVIELGEITSGGHGGRPSDDVVTVCDLTGTGAQDTAIACLAYQKAQAQGFGSPIDS